VTARARIAVAALAVSLAAYATYRLVLHVRAPVVPAVVTRSMDPHRALSRDVGTRLYRFLHDRPPRDRSTWPRLVALTFDDGPYPVETPLLLDALRDLNVRATFFLIGRDAQEFPELTRRIARNGHEIANHTLTHPNLDELDAAGVQRELDGGREALSRLVRDPAIGDLMRPPHGRFTEETIRAAQAGGFHVILWNDDPGDWRSVGPAEIEAHIAQHATAPDIVLLHSGRLATVEMLPAIVARFRRAGFSFVTVTELMRDVPTAIIDHPERLPLPS
jgi:peptidoglycan/xylan/chitin deacetylase (PgdA/CDA1 family)